MNEDISNVTETERGVGAEQSVGAPTDTGANDAATSETGDTGNGDSGDDGTTATGSATGDPARKRRRRGKRGGRRHKKKPATGASTDGAEADDDDDSADDATGEVSEAATASGDETAKPPSQQRPRAQQQRARQPRPPRARRAVQANGAAEANGTAQSSSAQRAAAAEVTQDGVTDADASPAGEADVADAADGADAAQATTPAARKRRRRRRSGAKKPADGAAAAAEGAETSAEPKEKPKTEKAKPEQQSTRLAARALRKDKQRQQGRRRPRRLTDEDIRHLRGGAKTMLVHAHDDRTQIAVLEEGVLIEHYVARKGHRTTMAGNVYLGRVQNVLPGMEAAFIDFGRGRNGVLYAGEVNYSAEDLDGGQIPRIEKVLKPGQGIMVQVTKDPIGAKGARLTSQISLAGRYLVLAPEQQVSGISRRLADNERSRLRQILRDIAPKEHGVIVRTAAEGATREQLELDLQNLVKIWDAITKNSKKGKAPQTLYEEPELTMRVVRDIFSGDFERVIVDARGVFEELKGYLEETAPDLIDRLQLHDGALPLFEEYRVTEQIHKALERKVWLPSGGSIVIDRTEAMTVIDVNTGKFTGKGGNLEETVFKNNCEAAEEVARQLRLRDIGGIIVIDFIDMIDPKHQVEVLRTLKRALSRDKTRSQVFEISNLGLVEMTRKKVSEGLLEAFSEPCPNCVGRGIVITHEID